MKKQFQYDILLNYLAEHGKATTKEIVEVLWILAPQKQIEILRHKGHSIKTVPVEGQKYSEYVYHPEPQMELSL